MALISIAMSVRNGAATLAPALQSLVDQTHTEWELLLIDDGSTDDTPRIAQSFGDARIRYVRHDDSRGLPARLNEAVGLARGEWLARMDADDIAYPERLERQLAFLEQHAEIDLVGCAAVVFREDGAIVGRLGCRSTHEEISRAPWRGFNDLLHPAWFARTEWFRRFPFDPAYRKSQDRELLLRAWRTSRFACLTEPLLGYRQEQLDLRKIAVSRWYMTRALAAGVARGDLVLLPGIAEQFAKLALDAIAVGTGLRYRLLRHRAAPVPSDEAEAWRDVWAQVNRATYK